MLRRDVHGCVRLGAGATAACPQSAAVGCPWELGWRCLLSIAVCALERGAWVEAAAAGFCCQMSMAVELGWRVGAGAGAG